MHRVLPRTSTVRLFCTRDRFATPSVDAAVEKGCSTWRVKDVLKKLYREIKMNGGPLPTFQITSNQNQSGGGSKGVWEGFYSTVPI